MENTVWSHETGFGRGAKQCLVKIKMTWPYLFPAFQYAKPTSELKKLGESTVALKGKSQRQRQAAYRISPQQWGNHKTQCYIANEMNSNSIGNSYQKRWVPMDKGHHRSDNAVSVYLRGMKLCYCVFWFVCVTLLHEMSIKHPIIVKQKQQPTGHSCVSTYTSKCFKSRHNMKPNYG